MQVALGYAEGHLLRGETPLDAEGQEGDPTHLPLDYARELLDRISADPGFSPEELEDHPGRPPIKADRDTHVLMSELLRQAFPTCYIVGEEATKEEWEVAEQAPSGALIFSVDAIDGSLPYEALSFGYSTNVLAFRRAATQTHLTLAAVANSSRFVAVYEDAGSAGSVWVGSLTPSEPEAGDDFSYAPRLKSMAEPACQNWVDGTVALVAAQAKHRVRAAELLSDPSLTIFTTGGAPAALGLVLGRLEALVTTDEQAVHDAAYLPILASLGVPIVTHTGVPLSLPDVLNFFGKVAVSAEDRLARPVPPFVAAREDYTARRLAGALTFPGHHDRA